MTFTFTDNFSPPSPLWSNSIGNWTASNGHYYAQNPSNNPTTYSGLPYDYTNSNLVVTVTVNVLSDGGIWLDTDGSNHNGIVLVLGGNGYGGGARGGPAGNSVYWSVWQNGALTDGLSEVNGVFTPGSTYTITAVVNGNTYKAYVDPDGIFDANSVLLTTLVNSTFSSGHVGLYDFYSGLSFSNFSISGGSNTPPVPVMLDAIHNSTTGLTVLSGTSEANSSISVYDGTKLIGTVTADANGVWNLKANVTGNNIHSYTEKSTDLAGNTVQSAGVTLYTPSANKTLQGGAGDDVLIGGPNDTLSGKGGANTFVFNPDFGKDTITDFNPSHDVIAFAQSLFPNGAGQVISRAHDSKAGVVIVVDANDAVTLTGITVAQLQSHVSDFHFFV
jgi:hypothetical protein